MQLLISLTNNILPYRQYLYTKLLFSDKFVFLWLYINYKIIIHLFWLKSNIFIVFAQKPNTPSLKSQGKPSIILTLGWICMFLWRVFLINCCHCCKCYLCALFCNAIRLDWQIWPKCFLSNCYQQSIFRISDVKCIQLCLTYEFHIQ